ncbi:MAG: histidine kinase [Bacteroidales bacterium]|nr:histidine kinase [Bacteroidales bacterium]
MALLVGVGLPLDTLRKITFREYLLMCFPSAVVEITIYFIIYLLNYAFSAREEMLEQREKAQKAEYQYFRLKQQVNPHFLFNSLNILDGIVCGDNPEQASDYIHKLSSIYRYMLSNEGNVVVSLREELVFVGLYVELLKIRFPEGLDVQVDVRGEDMDRRVVPCAVQLLVENAVKHNVIGADNVLKVIISSDGENLTVKNNICLKMSAVSSTGVGQKYIKSEYMRRSGKSVTAIDTGKEYIFNLPLL